MSTVRLTRNGQELKFQNSKEHFSTLYDVSQNVFTSFLQRFPYFTILSVVWQICPSIPCSGNDCRFLGKQILSVLCDFSLGDATWRSQTSLLWKSSIIFVDLVDLPSFHNSWNTHRLWLKKPMFLQWFFGLKKRKHSVPLIQPRRWFLPKTEMG